MIKSPDGIPFTQQMRRPLDVEACGVTVQQQRKQPNKGRSRS
jgi:hypothetical protein